MKNFTEKELDKYNYYKKHYGEERALEAVAAMRAVAYRNNNFERVYSNIEEPFGPYRGYTNGSITYRRIDGGPVSEYDLSQLRKIILGQVTNWHGNAGDTTVSVTYTLDSSD